MVGRSAHLQRRSSFNLSASGRMKTEGGRDQPRQACGATSCSCDLHLCSSEPKLAATEVKKVQCVVE